RWRASHISLRDKQRARRYQGDQEQTCSSGAQDLLSAYTKHPVPLIHETTTRMRPSYVPYFNRQASQSQWSRGAQGRRHLSHCPLAQTGLCISLWITSWITRRHSWIGV